MVTKAQVISALKKCFDPEVGISVVDLGLIDEIKVSGGNVNIKMILTSPACPMGSLILEDVREKVSKVKGVKKVDVELSSKAWSPDRMSKKAKKKVGWS